MAQPQVSILIPVYNVEDYLSRCLDSVLSQTLPNIEVICVNDGSTDHSPDILKKYQEMDSRIIIVNKENGGLPSARNAGIDRASGKYVGFVDSDDFVEPTMFEKLYNTAEKEKSDVVICGANILPENPRANDWLYACLSPEYKKYEEFDPDVIFNNITTTPFLWRTLIKRQLLEENHLRLAEDIMLGEDKAFQCKVYPLAKSITVIPDKLYNYFWCREGSLMNQTVYSNPEKKVLEHGRLIENISETVLKYNDKTSLKKAFLEWSIPFIYDDFISISLNNKIDLASKLIRIWNQCEYAKYEFDIPEWKREMMDYFEEVSQSEKIFPKLSMIIFVDTEAEYLEETLKKVLNQSLKEIEFIIVNNGTKNENYSILHKYLFKDKRIRLLNIAHISYAEALNRAVMLSSAEYVVYMETYDWYAEKTTLEKWLKYAKEQEADVCASIPCYKDFPESLSAEYLHMHFSHEDISKFIESDFHNVIFRTKFLNDVHLVFHNSSILTGFEYLVKACVSSNRLAWYNDITYIQGKMYRPDWISTDKCKTVLRVLEMLMKLSVEKDCGYLHTKIIELINSDKLGKMLINNTRAFKALPEQFPNGENSQIEVVDELLKIASLVDPDMLEKHGYSNDITYLRTIYKVINERHKFLADLSNQR